MAVSRSQQAVVPGQVRTVEAGRRDLPVGMWGIAMLILTEGALFGMTIGSYWYLRYRQTAWPPPGVEDPKVALPLALTAILAATAVPMFLAAGAARKGLLGAARAFLVSAFVVQAAYLAVQVLEFRDDLDHFSPRATAYGSVYFGMLALHHLHVVVGLLLDVAIFARLTRGLTNYRVVGVRAIAWYWAFVAAVAVPVVITQVSPSL